MKTINHKDQSSVHEAKLFDIKFQYMLMSNNLINQVLSLQDYKHLLLFRLIIELYFWISYLITSVDQLLTVDFVPVIVILQPENYSGPELRHYHNYCFKRKRKSQQW